MIALFLLAGVAFGFRHNPLALAMGLPVIGFAAWLSSRLGLIEAGFGPAIALCVVFQIGYFIGCIIHSKAIDRAEERERLGEKSQTTGV